MMKRWRDIPGWEGYYQVSDVGEVKSVQRTIVAVNGIARTIRERVLSLAEDGGGYLVAGLYRGGHGINMKVHVAVILAFVGPRPEGGEVRHLDDDKWNNVPSNLKWGTHSENNFDRVRNGIHPMSIKTHCSQGHKYIEENIYYRDGGRTRICRICRSEWQKKADAKYVRRRT